MQKLLLHICCGPCGTRPATLLSADYEIIGYFYNPNIWPYEEWLKRYEAFKKFCGESEVVSDFFPKIALMEEEYNLEHQKYLEVIKGLEKEPEGGARCSVCFRFRLEEAARFAKEIGADLFATTLTIGRNKRPEIINPIGLAIALRPFDELRVVSNVEPHSSGSSSIKFFEANFKKQDGTLKGKKIADEHGLYRQHYCGCEFAMPIY